MWSIFGYIVDFSITWKFRGKLGKIDSGPESYGKSGDLGNLGKNWENLGISGVTKNIKIFSGVIRRSRAEQAEQGVTNSRAERGLYSIFLHNFEH